MKIGIIADSHDRLSKLKKAIKILKQEKVELLLHAGDIVAPFVVPILADIKTPVYAVYGNNDGEKKGLEKEFKKFGLTIQAPPLHLTYKGLRITIFHILPEKGVRTNENDLIVFGHTHKPKVFKRNPTILNPGELCGWVYNRSTFALFDTDINKVTLKKL